MNDYWHIPRASLASSSSASSASSTHRSNKINAQPPTVALDAKSAPTRQRKERELVGATATATKMTHGGNRQTRPGQTKHISSVRRESELSATSAATAATAAAAAAAVLAAASASATTTAIAAKRGSRSSQGSSGSSNNSTRSAASGSLLLTAANLERFTAIHKKQQLQKPAQHNRLYIENVPPIAGSSNTYATNLTQALQQQHLQHQPQHQQLQQNNKQITGANNDATIITMDPNLDFIKTKDLDTVSIASSMHFTMVNGEGGPPKKPKRGLCDRGRQVTVLIVSMSTIFLLLILGMVYALEMRAREMPQS